MIAHTQSVLALAVKRLSRAVGGKAKMTGPAQLLSEPKGMVTDKLAADWAGNFSGVVAGQCVDAFLDQLFARRVEEQRMTLASR